MFSSWKARACIPLFIFSAFGLMLLGSAFSAERAYGQGFSVSEQSACVMGRAGTGTARPCDDGSAMYFNPAGLTRSSGAVVSGGGTFIYVQGSFTDDRTRKTTDLENDPRLAPYLYASYSAEKWATGLGVFVPYGLGTTWPEDDFAGRFAGYENSLQSIYVQPTVAYEVLPGFSLGAGLDIVFGSVDLNQRLDLADQTVLPGVTFAQLGIPPRTDFADANLQGSGTGIGGNFGAQWQVTDWLDVGARYTLAVPLDYEGDASFRQVATGLTLPAGNPLTEDGDDEGDASDPAPLDAVVRGQFAKGAPLGAQAVKTSITMPSQFTAGVSVQPTPALLLLADYQRIGWSSFDELELSFEQAPDTRRIENYESTDAVRLGVEYTFSEKTVLRGGWLHNTAAAPDETVTPLLPENDRNHYTVGIGFSTVPGFEFNVAYQYLDQGDRRGRVTEPTSGEEPTTALNSGLYSFSAHLISVTLTGRF